MCFFLCFFFSSRRRHTRCGRDWSSDVCSSDLGGWLKNDAYSMADGQDATRAQPLSGCRGREICVDDEEVSRLRLVVAARVVTSTWKETRPCGRYEPGIPLVRPLTEFAVESFHPLTKGI